MRNTYEKIGGTIYPVTYADNGMVLVDYPLAPPSSAKLNAEGRTLMEEFGKKMLEKAKEKGFKVILNGEEI